MGGGAQPLEVRRAALLNVNELRIERSNACLIRRPHVQTGTKLQPSKHKLGYSSCKQQKQNGGTRKPPQPFLANIGHGESPTVKTGSGITAAVEPGIISK